MHDSLEAVCRLAHDLRRFKSKSPVELLEESGYLARRQTISVRAIAERLRQAPNWVEAWFTYSQDKRTSSGWYVQQAESGCFVVADYPDGETLEFKDRVDACAEFVSRELRSLAGNAA